MNGNDVVTEWLANIRPGGKTLAVIVDELLTEERTRTLAQMKRLRDSHDQMRDALNDLLDWVARDTEGRFNSIDTPDEIVRALIVSAPHG